MRGDIRISVYWLKVMLVMLWNVTDEEQSCLMQRCTLTDITTIQRYSLSHLKSEVKIKIKNPTYQALIVTFSLMSTFSPMTLCSFLAKPCTLGQGVISLLHSCVGRSRLSAIYDAIDVRRIMRHGGNGWPVSAPGATYLYQLIRG